MESDTPDDQLQEFWSQAQRHAHVGDLDVVMGTSWGESLVPPVWTFGGTVEESDALLALVLSGKKTAITGLLEEYESDDEPLPHKGDLSIILDAEGVPRALIRTVEVVVVPFSELTLDQAEAEGEPDLDSWRRSHRTFWEHESYEITDGTRVVWEQFTVVYQG